MLLPWLCLRLVARCGASVAALCACPLLTQHPPCTPPPPRSRQLLGAMAHCAPKQLGSCLPVVVPRLGEVLADPHPKVASAARTALNEVGSVIRNPEVAKLVPVLLSGAPGAAGAAAGAAAEQGVGRALPAPHNCA